MAGHKSRRCSVCAVYWPLDEESYQPCPECEGNTWGSTHEPLLNAEAWSRKTHAEFERFYEKREAERRKQVVAGLERDIGAISEAA